MVIGVGGQNATALAAYVVGDAGSVDVAELKAFVAQRMPVHMVPASVTVLDTMPLTPGRQARQAGAAGSDDRGAPVRGAGHRCRSGGRSDLRRHPRRRRGVGHGIVLRPRRQLAVGDAGGGAGVGGARCGGVGARVFDAPSVRELIAAVSGNAATLAPIVAVEPRPDQIPLSFAQARMWFINQYDTTQSTYNVPAVLRLTGDPRHRCARTLLVDLVERQQVLRTVFPTVEGVPGQRICDVTEFGQRGIWQIVDTEEQLLTEVSAGFDVSSEWPLRVRLLHVSGDEYLLGLVVHHIAADGESMLPLLSDIVTAYTARSADRNPRGSRWRCSSPTSPSGSTRCSDRRARRPRCSAGSSRTGASTSPGCPR